MDAAFVEQLRRTLGDGGLVTRPEQLRTYECDGLTNFRVVPVAVALPDSAEQVVAVVRACHEAGVPFVARGSGTGLSGGALPVEGGIVISLARLNRILEVDLANQRVVVEPGVLNQQVTQRVVAAGYFYAPDPSSQQVCSIGGNVAENSGGAHCLKYGFTVTHVTALEVVLPDGSVVHLGGPVQATAEPGATEAPHATGSTGLIGAPDPPGYDLAGVFVGSEGTLGIATRITLRVVKRPEVIQTLIAAFGSSDDAGAAVSGIVAAGILPAAAEMMDRLSLDAAEAAVHAGYPECQALLLVELDGAAADVADGMARVQEICRSCGAGELRLARSDEERAVVWKGRKAAFAAMGRISPNYIVQDGVIPRTALPRVLREIERLSAAAGLRV
ncbi:MAG TPA: FAD-binding protein, partial [Longimicrobiales bacterium]